MKEPAELRKDALVAMAPPVRDGTVLELRGPVPPRRRHVRAALACPMRALGSPAWRAIRQCRSSS